MRRNPIAGAKKGYGAAGLSNSPATLEELLPKASLWRKVTDRASGSILRVCDPALAVLPPPQSERLLQAVWYDDRWRPPELRTVEGEGVRVCSPGRWNLEAGPDFLEATLEVGPQRRQLRCDVEVHLRPAEWDAHGHGADPRYRNVQAHVTYAPGRAPVTLPPTALRISLRDALAANPRFSFEAIDLAAYPYAIRRSPCPCTAVLSDWGVEERVALLEAAGEERLRRKAERLRPAMDERGVEQVFYEEVLCALGYRDNKAPFRQLAERLSLAELRAQSQGNPETAYALLSGVAGLLPESPRSTWDAETRRWLRGLWDIWWRKSSIWSGRCLTPSEWKLSGFRPANHPLRRLAAAAWLFARPSSLWVELGQDLIVSGGRLRRAVDRLDAPLGGYWERRLTLGGVLQRRPVALLGRSRAAAVLYNAVLPLFAATGDRAAFRTGWAETLPDEGESRRILHTATILFGPDVPPSLIRPAIRRQGLLQIFQDFCLHDRSACRDCPLPDRLHVFR